MYDIFTTQNNKPITPYTNLTSIIDTYTNLQIFFFFSIFRFFQISFFVFDFKKNFFKKERRLHHTRIDFLPPPPPPTFWHIAHIPKNAKKSPNLGFYIVHYTFLNTIFRLSNKNQQKALFHMIITCCTQTNNFPTNNYIPTNKEPI